MSIYKCILEKYGVTNLVKQDNFLLVTAHGLVGFKRFQYTRRLVGDRKMMYGHEHEQCGHVTFPLRNFLTTHWRTDGFCSQLTS